MNQYIRQPYPNELYHHGIKGQKWGVRRYQNPDGSLTPAGKKRYLSKDGEALTKKGKKEIAKRTETWNKNGFEVRGRNVEKKMTDKEGRPYFIIADVFSSPESITNKANKISDKHDQISRNVRKAIKNKTGEDSIIDKFELSDGNKVTASGTLNTDDPYDRVYANFDINTGKISEIGGRNYTTFKVR